MVLCYEYKRFLVCMRYKEFMNPNKIINIYKFFNIYTYTYQIFYNHFYVWPIIHVNGIRAEEAVVTKDVNTNNVKSTYYINKEIAFIKDINIKVIIKNINTIEILNIIIYSLYDHL